MVRYIKTHNVSSCVFFLLLLIPRMDGSTTSGNCPRLSQIVTLSGDQNEVFESEINIDLRFESLVDFQRLISWNPRVKRIFSFSTFDFYGLINLYTKSFSLWRRQKFHHRTPLRYSSFRNACNSISSFSERFLSTACPNKNLTIFERKIQDYKWKFWNKFWLYCDNKGLKFCLQFVPRKSMI